MKLFLKYYEFLDVFSRKDVNTLFKHNNYNYIILLLNNKQFFFEFLYKMFQKELRVFCKYLNNYLHKNFIKASFLLIVTSIFFV